MTEVRFYDRADDSLLRFAVIVTRSAGRWVFCRRRDRATLEIPGGHREPGEDILAAARRELWEETGAVDFVIRPVCVYSVTAPDRMDGQETFGMLYLADVARFDPVLTHEIGEIVLLDRLPGQWTYPDIQPVLLREALRRTAEQAPARPTVRPVRSEDLPACAALVRESFQTVADEFGLTEENAPRFTAFSVTEQSLRRQFEDERRPMFVCEADGVPCGFCSLRMEKNGECELNHLAVLPEYRRRGIGKLLLSRARSAAAEAGCAVMNIGIVEENRRLRAWYEQNGAVHTGTKKFPFFPFTCGYMKIPCRQAGSLYTETAR